MAGDYRIRFLGDLGNLAQFTAGIVGSATTIKNSFRNAAASPVTSLKIPGLQVGNLTTTVDSANRVLIQSGQVFHRVITGYTKDLSMLDAATARSAKAGAGLNYGGYSFGSRQGQAVYGTSVNPKTGMAGVYAKDLKPTYSTFLAGDFKQIMGDVDKINAANMALVPASNELLAIEKKAVLETTKYEAIRQTILRNQTQELEKQAILRAKLNAMYTLGGGTAPKFGPGGVMLSPGNIVSTGTQAEINRLVNTPIYTAQRLATVTGTKTVKGVPVNIYQTKAEMAGQLQGEIALAKAGTLPAAQAANLQTALYQARSSGQLGIAEVERQLAERNITLGKIATALAAGDVKQAAFLTKVKAQQKAVATKYAPEYATRQMALTTPAIPAEVENFLQKSKSFRKDLMKSLQMQTPYGTAAFAKEFNEKVTGASVSKDFKRGVTNISLSAKDAAGAVGTFNTSIKDSGTQVEKMQGRLNGGSGALKMVAMDFKKVLEWTVATTLVFGAFGAAIGTFSKLNQVNSDLQRFQIVAKSTGEETKAAFDSIAQIAYRTATPLTELTTVMDDMALATRRVGQTFQEWTVDTAALAEAVGIYTNIAGIDTVKATDQLSAAFKQLQVSPTQLVGVLNKVTAVAGGNAQAVQDIVSSLGSVAEASKAAGFNIDEMIAAVQVLSQVTNKTAADIATSFKNLFGAINAPASEKFLKSYNIAIRDSSGNLRDYLDIMKDVYDAIQSGTIPQGRVQDLLRAIAGGPRRAPDAAAVLGNFPRILETIDTALNATNDAWMANAKIVETNSARLQKLRTAFDTALVNQFTDSINDLVESLTKAGTVFNSIFGGVGGTALKSVIQFGVIAGGIVLLTKAISGLKGGILELSKTWGLLKVASTIAGTIGGNAYQIAKPPPAAGWAAPAGATIIATGAAPAYRSQVNLEPAERPGYTRYVTQTKAGPGTRQPPPMYEYWPKTPTAQKPPAINPIPASLVSANKLWTGNRGLRFAGAGLAGAALGAGLGLAGQATGSNLFSTIGTTVGMMGLISMNPLVMAAGGATIAVSQLFQSWQDGIEKTKEKQATLMMSLVDQTKALSDAQKNLNVSKQMQEAAAKTIANLGSKTSLTTDETESLTAAQSTYVTSTLDVMNAETALADSRERLLSQLPQLEKYKNLARKALSLSSQDLKALTIALSKDILEASGTFVAKGGGYREAFPLPSTITGPAIAANPQVTSPYFGRTTFTGAAPTKTPTDVAAIIREGGLSKAIEFLRTPRKVVGAAGVEMSPELTSALMMALDLATVEEQKSIEFRNAVDIFQKAVLTMPGALSPLQVMSQNLANFASQTQANAAFGLYSSEQVANATARQSAGAAILTLAKQRNLPTGNEPWEYAQRGRVTQKTINEQLFGPSGFVSRNGQAVSTKIDSTQAKDFFKIMVAINPAIENLKENTGEFGELAYQYFKMLGYEVENLHDKTLDEIDALDTLRGDIDSSVKSAKQGLFGDLLALQAQIQGGEFKGNEAVGQAQVDQINDLVAAYVQLGKAFKANAGILPELQARLGSIKVLQGLLLVDTNQLLPSLLEAARTMGFTGDQVNVLRNAVLKLIVALAAVDAIPTIVKRVEIEVHTAITSGNARRRGQEGGLLDRTDYTNLITGTKGKSVSDIIAEIEKLFSNAAGSAFGQIPSTAGGSTAAVDKGTISDLEIPKEWKDSGQNIKDMLAKAVEWAKKYQRAIPGEDKAHIKDLVAVMDGNNRILLQKGVAEEYLRKAMEAQTEELKKQNDLLAKADTIRRIRVGAGDFAAIANVPINKTSGISVGSPQGPITISLNITGQVLTPAQMQQLGNSIGAALGRQISSNG